MEEIVEYKVEVRYVDGRERTFIFMTQSAAMNMVADFIGSCQSALLEDAESVGGPYETVRTLGSVSEQ